MPEHSPLLVGAADDDDDDGGGGGGVNTRARVLMTTQSLCPIHRVALFLLIVCKV